MTNQERVEGKPTDEQLARFMCVQVYGPACSDGEFDQMKRLLTLPLIRDGALKVHRQFQAQVSALAGNQEEDQ